MFRNLFVDEQDEIIAVIVNNYFNAVSKCWTEAWNEEGFVLARTIGFNALMFILPKVIEKIGIYNRVIDCSRFEEIFRGLNLSNRDFDEEYFSLSGFGQSDIVKLFKGRLE